MSNGQKTIINEKVNAAAAEGQALRDEEKRLRRSRAFKSLPKAERQRLLAPVIALEVEFLPRQDAYNDALRAAVGEIDDRLATA